MGADEGRVRSVKRRTEEESVLIDQIVMNLVGKYSKELDEFISDVKAKLPSDKLSNEEIEDLTLKIPIFMYFAVDGVEALGLQSDTAKGIRTEMFQEAFLKADGTIKDKEHTAGSATINEYIVEMAYARAYKKLKSKLDIAEQLCQASRKVLQKRISEINLGLYQK